MRYGSVLLIKNDIFYKIIFRYTYMHKLNFILDVNQYSKVALVKDFISKLKSIEKQLKIINSDILDKNYYN